MNVHTKRGKGTPATEDEGMMLPGQWIACGSGVV